MAEKILELNGIDVNYGSFIAVTGVSMSIEKGQSVSVIGTNGAGKSTLMKAIAGIVPLRSGRITFMGEDITGKPADIMVKKGICLVPQGGRCFSRMSVEDNLLIGSYVKSARGDGQKTLSRVYELFPVLHEKRKLPSGSLSGGQRQMVAIGRALMSRPRLICFDELSLGLAPVVVKDIYAAIRQISADEGLSVILAEQDTKRAMRETSYTYILLKGSIALEGKPSELTDEQVKNSYLGI